jgi:hypothetical protein
VREFYAASGGPPATPEQLIALYRKWLHDQYGTLSDMFSEFVGELDQVYVELELMAEATEPRSWKGIDHERGYTRI